MFEDLRIIRQMEDNDDNDKMNKKRGKFEKGEAEESDEECGKEKVNVEKEAEEESEDGKVEEVVAVADAVDSDSKSKDLLEDEVEANVGLESLIPGVRLEIFWPGEQQWYSSVLSAIDNDDGNTTYRFTYDDGDIDTGRLGEG